MDLPLTPLFSLLMKSGFASRWVCYGVPPGARACRAWKPAGNPMSPSLPAASRDGRLVYVRAWTGPHRLTETDDSLGVACGTDSPSHRHRVPFLPTAYPRGFGCCRPVLLLRRLFWLQIFKPAALENMSRTSLSLETPLVSSLRTIKVSSAYCRVTTPDAWSIGYLMVLESLLMSACRVSGPIRFAEIWLMMICCKRKALFVRWKVLLK